MIPFIPYSVLHLVDSMPLGLAALLAFLVLFPPLACAVHLLAVLALVGVRLAGELDAALDALLSDGALSFGELLAHQAYHSFACPMPPSVVQ